MLEYEGVEVPKKAFLGLVEGYLSENYRLYLIVEGLTVKKEFGCDHCGAKIEAWSPDDHHTILELKGGPESIERKIECPTCEGESIRYWTKEARGMIKTG
jgi:DNA-directed RNA polymerase subunit RPC12/RpoP